MIGIVSWAAARARMMVALAVLALLAGGYSYVGLPKEGEPDIEIPALFVSVPFPGISAADSGARSRPSSSTRPPTMRPGQASSRMMAWSDSSMRGRWVCASMPIM